ncbi:hypothetical protein CRUP_029410 [Coryphaenoides rupestris]|nr:hypothetical protein CRUP_029410 [Coryphaenoides rupestris]
MECASRVPRYSWCDFAFSVAGVGTFLFDWGSDAWAAAELYGRGELSWSGLLLACMLLGSVVVQTFSWFWFQYDRDLDPDQHLGQGFHVKLSCLLHVLQLGFFCR